MIKNEIILLDLSGSMTCTRKMDMVVDSLKAVVESSNAKKIYVYGLGMHKIALLTKEQYTWLTEEDTNVVVNKLQYTIKNIDSNQGTFFHYDKDFPSILKVIPKRLGNNIGTRITIISDSDLVNLRGELDSVQTKVQDFILTNYGNLRGMRFFNVDDSLARLFWKELKSLQVVTKKVSVKPKVKKAEIEPTIIK